MFASDAQDVCVTPARGWQHFCKLLLWWSRVAVDFVALASDQCAHDRLGVAPTPSDALSSSPSTLSSFPTPSSQGALGASVVVLVLFLQSCRNVVSMLLTVGSIRPSGIDHLSKSVCFNTTVLIVFSLFEIPCRQSSMLLGIAATFGGAGSSWACPVPLRTSLDPSFCQQW